MTSSPKKRAFADEQNAYMDDETFGSSSKLRDSFKLSTQPLLLWQLWFCINFSRITYFSSNLGQLVFITWFWFHQPSVLALLRWLHKGFRS